MNTEVLRQEILEAYAGLPEAYQPAWGLEETLDKARRGCADRLQPMLATITTWEPASPLVILDIGCAQGYFSLALQAELTRAGRDVRVIGVDYLEDNVRFCRQLAEYHGSPVDFIHDRFDAGFFERNGLQKVDVVLALNVLHHIGQLEGLDALRKAVAAIHANAPVLLCEVAQPKESLDWISSWHASDDTLLEAYPFRRCLGRFGTHLTDVPRPLYLCNSRAVWVGGTWYGYDSYRNTSHDAVPDSFAAQRRFYFSDQLIIKGFRLDGPYGAFNRDEAQREVEALEVLSDQPDRFPTLLSTEFDGEEGWLVRTFLPGSLATGFLASLDTAAWVAVAGDVLADLSHFERHGLHHGDIRPWNILIDPGHPARVIDFGALERGSSRLDRLALAATLLAFTREQVPSQGWWYQLVHPLSEFPAELHRLVRFLYACPPAEFSFETAMACVEQGPAKEGADPVSVDASLLRASSKAMGDIIQSHADHAAQAQARLAHASESAAAARSALADATESAAALRHELDRVLQEVAKEREAATAALADAARYAASLEQARAQERDQAVERIGQLEKELEQFRQTLGRLLRFVRWRSAKQPKTK